MVGWKSGLRKMLRRKSENSGVGVGMKQKGCLKCDNGMEEGVGV